MAELLGGLQRFLFSTVVMTCKFNTKFSNSDILGQEKQKFLSLALAIAKNPIQGGKSVDLQDGMCFLAELISNCFF